MSVHGTESKESDDNARIVRRWTLMSDGEMSSAASATHAPLARELAGRAEREVAVLHARLKEEQQLHRFLAGLADSLTAAHVSEALRRLNAGAKQLNLLAARDRAAADQLDNLQVELRVEVQELFQELALLFPAEVQRAGLQLDPRSRHPRYTLLDGLIEIRFDKSKLEAHVVPRDGRRTTLGIDTGPLVAYLDEEVQRLTGRAFEPRAFLELLSRAYREVLKSSEKVSGDSVPLKAIVAELAKSKGFRADEFNVDLSRLVRDESSAGRVRLENARDPKNGLLLWQLDQRGYYGYIRMEDGGNETP